MIFKKKIITPDKIDWYQEPQQLVLQDARQLPLDNNYQPRHTLVVFIGGAMDDVYGPVLQGVFIPYRLRNAQQQDIAYATHGSVRAIVELVGRWHKAGKKIVLVGHSWGANSAMRVARNLETTCQIELLVTLDAVSRRLPGKQIHKPGTVKQWLNIYIDYRKASMEYSNTVARLGGYWGYCRHADENIRLSRDGAEEVTHAQAARMFREVADRVQVV